MRGGEHTEYMFMKISRLHHLLKMRVGIKGIVLSILASMTSGASYFCNKQMLSRLNVETSVLLWFTLSLPYYLLYLSITRHLRSTLTEISHVVKEVVLVALASCSGALFWFWGTLMMTPASVALILQTNRIFTFILGLYLLGERLSIDKGIGALLAFSGVLTLTYSNEKVLLFPTMILLISSLSYAISNILAKIYVKKISPISLSFGRALFISITLLLYSLASRRLELQYFNSVIGFALLGAFLAPFLTIIMAYEAFKYIEISKFAILYSLSPFFTMLYGLLFFNLLPTLQQIIGGVAIVSGIALTMRSPKVYK